MSDQLNEALAKLEAAGYTEGVVKECIADLERIKREGTLSPDQQPDLEEALSGYYEVAALFELRRIGGLIGQLKEKVDELKRKAQQPEE